MPNNKVKKLSKLKIGDKVHPFSRKARQLKRVNREIRVERHFNTFNEYLLEHWEEDLKEIIAGYFTQNKSPTMQMKLDIYKQKCMREGLLVPKRTNDNKELLENGKNIVETERIFFKENYEIIEEIPVD